MNILYVGSLFVGSTVHYRVNGLRELGFNVQPLDTESYFPTQKRGTHSLWRRMCWGPPVWQLNADLLHEAERFRPDVVIIDKGLMIKPNTLLKLKSLKKLFLIHYSPDDQLNPTNQSRYYIAGIGLYDIHITTKSYNIEELYKAGAVNVVFNKKGFDPSVFYPRGVSSYDQKQLGAQVGFIGFWEKERADSMLYLARNGISVRIWGPNWKKFRKSSHPLIKIEEKALWGNNYPMAICATDINLCFLRKSNRDLHTSRSIEIPACGSFMIAERTVEHEQLFEENKEAAFFSSNDELLVKVRHYLAHSEERKQIAALGRQRCLSGGYSYAKRFSWLINYEVKK